MAPKTGKKRHYDKKPPNHSRLPRQTVSPKHDKSAGKKPSRNAPKPPQNGLFIWGRQAVLAALANPQRRVAKLYATAEVAEDLQQAIVTLPAERSAGASVAQRLKASGQRSRKTQPEGGLMGLGISPFMILCARPFSKSGSGIGTASRSARV